MHVLIAGKSLNSIKYAPGCSMNDISGPEVIKLVFMLNSVDHEISNARKYKNIKKFSLFRLR